MKGNAMDISLFMNQGILSIARTAAAFYFTDKKNRRFIMDFTPQLTRNAKIRAEQEQSGIHIPPFLIASIASRCNLHCTGCYARADGACSDHQQKAEMDVSHWKSIFEQANALGISFILLAGGEPLLRKDILSLAGNYPDIIFPVFTNGTLIDEAYIDLFHNCRNLIPVLSMEGTAADTDLRRGAGISDQLSKVMSELKQRQILYGTSVTVTHHNLEYVTGRKFVDELQSQGCSIIFYVEYVPVEKGTESLVLTDDDLNQLQADVQDLKAACEKMIILSFPGDEAAMGGCLAAGRGFFHINPTGGAEPCPFSPYSKLNLTQASLLEVLQSDFFEKVRAIEERADIHQGGCTLFACRQEVENI